MSEKRGEIELQFNWIFVMIAGAMVILLFVTFALRYQGASENEIAAKILTYATAMLSSSAISEGSSNKLDLPTNAEIRFDCETSKLAIKGLSQQIPGIVAAPRKFSDNSIITFAKTEKIPFPLANIMYISPYNTKYYFVHDSSTAAQAQNASALLPAEVKKELATDITKIRAESNPVIIVFFTAPQLTAELKSKDITIIQLQNNRIITYDKNLMQTKTASYAATAELAAGIINPADFECTQKKLFALIPAAAENQIKKINSIKTQNRCSMYYDTSVIPALNLLKAAKTAEEIRSAAKTIEEQNYFLKKQSCPTIY